MVDFVKGQKRACQDFARTYLVQPDVCNRGGRRSHTGGELTWVAEGRRRRPQKCYIFSHVYRQCILKQWACMSGKAKKPNLWRMTRICQRGHHVSVQVDSVETIHPYSVVVPEMSKSSFFSFFIQFSSILFPKS